MDRAISHMPAETLQADPVDRVRLAHDERHLRRKLLTLESGREILVDLPEAVALADGDAFILQDGGLITVTAAQEPLYEVTARDRNHLARLCWHLGNRHLPAQIEADRILIGRDHVIREMLTKLGATVREIEAPFSPERGAYHTLGGHNGHHHHHEHCA